jgi:nitrite reductase/ring-hydroxylating ferredoxin subunit
MDEKKLQRMDFLKYLTATFFDTGFQLINSFSKNIETSLNTNGTSLRTGTWVKAISPAELPSLPKLIFLNGYWVFIANEGESVFKALCPQDNSFLQYRLPENNLFCIRCSSTYCPSTGSRLNPEEPAKNNLGLKALPFKKDERGIFVYLEK